MASSQKIKTRINEIRSRVFDGSPKEQIKKDTVDVISEQDVVTKKKVEPELSEIKPNFTENENFKNYKNKSNNDINDYLGALDKKLNDFEIKIPDMEKGSRLRVQLDNEIEGIISQRLSTYLEALSGQIQQSRTLNRAIEDLSESYAKTNDLSEMKKEIEKVCEQAANKKLEEFNLLFQDHLSSLMKSLTSSNDEIGAKLKQNDDKISLLNTDVQNSIAKTKLDCANKNSATEEALFRKIESHFAENIIKIKDLEGTITDSIISSSKATDAVRKDLEVRLVDSLAKLEEFNLYSK